MRARQRVPRLLWAAAAAGCMQHAEPLRHPLQMPPCSAWRKISSLPGQQSLPCCAEGVRLLRAGGQTPHPVACRSCCPFARLSPSCQPSWPPVASGRCAATATAAAASCLASRLTRHHLSCTEASTRSGDNTTPHLQAAPLSSSQRGQHAKSQTMQVQKESKQRAGRQPSAGRRAGSPSKRASPSTAQSNRTRLLHDLLLLHQEGAHDALLDHARRQVAAVRAVHRLLALVHAVQAVGAHRGQLRAGRAGGWGGEQSVIAKVVALHPPRPAPRRRHRHCFCHGGSRGRAIQQRLTRLGLPAAGRRSAASKLLASLHGLPIHRRHAALPLQSWRSTCAANAAPRALPAMPAAICHCAAGHCAAAPAATPCSAATHPIEPLAGDGAGGVGGLLLGQLVHQLAARGPQDPLLVGLGGVAVTPAVGEALHHGDCGQGGRSTASSGGGKRPVAALGGQGSRRAALLLAFPERPSAAAAPPSQRRGPAIERRSMGGGPPTPWAPLHRW